MEIRFTFDELSFVHLAYSIFATRCSFKNVSPKKQAIFFEIYEAMKAGKKIKLSVDSEAFQDRIEFSQFMSNAIASFIMAQEDSSLEDFLSIVEVEENKE